MGKPKKVSSYPEQAYPSLEEFSSSRRGFLKRFAIGAVVAATGGKLLSGCQIYPFDNVAGDMVGPDYYDVRLPAEGNSSVYMYYGDYLQFAVAFVTYDEAVAEYYRNTPDDGLAVINSVLVDSDCDNLSGDSLATMEQNLLEALSENASKRVATDGQGIASLTLLIDSCEDGMIAGGMEDPDYP